MARSIFAGMTDYSHQSFEDIIEDLNTWKDICSERIKWIDENISSLESTGYWNRMAADFQLEIYFSKKFFNTVVSEITSIISEFDDEVRKNHIKRLNALAITADKENKSIGQVWHADYDFVWQDYGNKSFYVVEQIYGRTRDLVAGLTDLSNIASRLKDFTGKMKKKDSNTILNSAQFGDNAVVNFGNNNTITTTNIKVIEGSFDELKKILFLL